MKSAKPPDAEGAAKMKNAQHTPGPWRYRPREHDDWGFIRGPDRGDGSAWLVAVARSGKFEEEEELNQHRRNNTDPYEANARLIAAAPDMLDALQRILGIDDQCDLTDGTPDRCPGLDDPVMREPCHWCAARAALAKAEGRNAQ